MASYVTGAVPRATPPMEAAMPNERLDAKPDLLSHEPGPGGEYRAVQATASAPGRCCRESAAGARANG